MKSINLFSDHYKSTQCTLSLDVTANIEGSENNIEHRSTQNSAIHKATTIALAPFNKLHADLTSQNL